MLKLFIFFLSIYSLSASAVTVGGIKVYSKYGERVRFEVELFNLYNMDPKNIEIKIIPKLNHGFKNTMEEKLGEVSYGIYTSGGIGWVTVSSEDIVYNGEIDIVIEFKWPEGKTFRHYVQPLIGMPSSKPIEEIICPSKGIWIKCVE
jgi:hypothetical protein